MISTNTDTVMVGKCFTIAHNCLVMNLELSYKWFSFASAVAQTCGCFTEVIFHVPAFIFLVHTLHPQFHPSHATVYLESLHELMTLYGRLCTMEYSCNHDFKWSMVANKIPFLMMLQPLTSGTIVFESAFAPYVGFGVLMTSKLGTNEILMRYIAALVPWKF